MDYSTEVAIPSRTINLNVPIEVTSPEIKTLSTARFIAEGTTQALVDEILMTKFTVSNLVGNLDFLKSFSIAIVADNLPDVIIIINRILLIMLTNVRSPASFKSNILLKMLLKEKNITHSMYLVCSD